jgi:hypothetical protein
MDKYLIAAIKGYWRMGATIEEIIGVTGLKYWELEYLFSEFQKDHLLNSSIIN